MIIIQLQVYSLMMALFNNFLDKNCKRNTFSRVYVSGHQHIIGEIRKDTWLQQHESEPAPQKHGLGWEGQSFVLLR